MFRLGIRLSVVAVLLGFTLGWAHEARLRPARKITFPTLADGNSPSFWLNGKLHLFTSIAWPIEISVANSQFDEWESCEVDPTDLGGKAIWIEAAWLDQDGTVFGWYHHEPWGLYEESTLTAPKIGALVSYDGGKTVHDLGIILESGDPLDPLAANGFFTGGHGDVSVVLDQKREYFYFFFTNYGGPDENQGVVVARMAFADRFEPIGKVHKFHSGLWNEPGIGGRTTPILPAARAWQHTDPDSFWGPSIHWNTHLKSFVMLLNRASGEPGWAQSGIYICFAKALEEPEMWSKPRLLLDKEELPSWSTFYPQVIGTGHGGTDTLAGQTARFYVNGTSRWEIDFTVTDDSKAVAPPR
jgi:hypothetical protein